MTVAAPHLQLVTGERGERELNTRLIRNFLGMRPNEFTELTAMVRNKPWVAHIRTEEEHVRMLREAEHLNGYGGSYMLVNGGLDETLTSRYEPCKWTSAWNERAKDKNIGELRAVYIDCDPEREKGISSTDREFAQAWEVADRLRNWLESVVGRNAVGFGCSGNGHFLLVAVQAQPPSPDTSARISTFLGLLQKKFGIEKQVKIDGSVFNPARLMPAPGTWKRKGRNTEERPHRMTSFIALPSVLRVPLEALC